MSFVVRCRYVGSFSGGEYQSEGVGYFDAESRCTRDVRWAKLFDNEADAWAFAALSGELVPADCWAEEAVNGAKGPGVDDGSREGSEASVSAELDGGTHDA